MCRNIKPLFNFDPQATDAEIRDASLQFVRKITGMNKPSMVNHPAFDRAVDEVNRAIKSFLTSLATNSAPKNREVEAARKKARSANRFGTAKIKNILTGSIEW